MAVKKQEPAQVPSPAAQFQNCTGASRLPLLLRAKGGQRAASPQASSFRVPPGACWLLGCLQRMLDEAGLRRSQPGLLVLLNDLGSLKAGELIREP